MLEKKGIEILEKVEDVAVEKELLHLIEEMRETEIFWEKNAFGIYIYSEGGAVWVNYHQDDLPHANPCWEWHHSQVSDNLEIDYLVLLEEVA